MAWKDTIVEEIHKVREQIAKECDYDIDKVFERIKELEKQHPERLIRKKDLPKAG